MRFIARAFLGIHRIGVGGLPGRVEGGLQANLDLAAQSFKPMQHRRFKNALMRLCRDITEGQKNSVTGVVVLGIKIPQLLIAEVGNVFRVTAAIEVVGIGRKQFVTEAIPQNRRGR